MSGALPVVGHTVEFMREPLGLLARGHREHGEIFTLRLGNRAAVVALGPERNRFVFDETDARLSLREAYPFMSRMFSEGFFFFAAPDEYLRQKSLIIDRFKPKQMASYHDVMVAEVRAAIDRLGESGTFDLLATMGPLAMHIAGHCFLGTDFRQRLGAYFFELFRDFSFGLDPILPGWLPLPRFAKSQTARAKLHELLSSWVRERRDHPLDPPDFFQMLVQSKYPGGDPVPDETIIHLILLLVWAGHETTAGHVSWGLIDLLRHPGELERVLEEQESVLGRSLELSAERAQSLRRIELALVETERLHPVAYVMMRLAREDVVIGEHFVARGTPVFVCPWESHRIRSIYADPERFSPDRHGDEMNQDRPYSLIGFGGGTHRCAGVHFAYREMKVILTLFLQAFELELVAPDVKPQAGPVTKWPASPCRVRYRRR